MLYWIYKTSLGKTIKCEACRALLQGRHFMSLHTEYVNQLSGLKINILKAIKNATGIRVIFPINISLIPFVCVLTSVPNVGERFTKP